MRSGSAGNVSKGNGGTASSTLIPPSSESDDGTPGRSHSRRRKGGKKNDAEVDGAEEGYLSKEARMANNAKHRTLRMKTPKDTCAFMPGCNDTFNNSKLQEGQACACYSLIDPETSERVDCSSLIDEVTNQALYDKTQKLFKSGGRKAVVEYRNECRAMWLASKQQVRHGGSR
jgi:hypothetical protein